MTELPPVDVEFATLKYLVAQIDVELDLVKYCLTQMVDFTRVSVNALHMSIDCALHGTGCTKISELDKANKTILGIKWEVVLKNLLGLEKGRELDFNIAGVEVDCKFTMGDNWMIPPSCVGQVCILGRYSEKNNSFAVGFIRANEDHLNPSRNRDSKRTLSVEGKKHIDWVMDTTLTDFANVDDTGVANVIL